MKDPDSNQKIGIRYPCKVFDKNGKLKRIIGSKQQENKVFTELVDNKRPFAQPFKDMHQVPTEDSEKYGGYKDFKEFKKRVD